MQKKTIRKSPTPKPSTLLARALALFGKNGEFWIKGAGKNEISAGFIDRETLPKKCKDPIKYALNGDTDTITTNEVKKIIEDSLKEIVDSGNDPLQIAKEVVARTKELATRFIETPAHVAFCSIGAICQINTPNEYEAGRWLAKAINAHSYENPHKYDDCTDGRDFIIQFNDKQTTTWPMMKAKFQKAIALAKAAGR